MNHLFQQLTEAESSWLLTGLMTALGLGSIENIALVAARFTGLIGVGAFLGHPLLSWRIRLTLIILLTMVVAPTLPSEMEEPPRITRISHAFNLLGDSTKATRDRDDEAIRTKLSQPPSFASLAEFDDGSMSFPTKSHMIAKAIKELALGAVLGLGAIIVLSGLRLGGEWLDRHSGLGIGSVLNPEFLSEGSATSGMTLLFGVTALLLIEPLGGHLIFMGMILETFHSLPIGTVAFSESFAEFLLELLRLSLLLGLRVAMPFVVAMSFVDMAISFWNRSSPSALAPAMLVTRSLVALLLVVAAWPGIVESVTTTTRDAFSQTTNSPVFKQNSSSSF
jgi:flagellar biosynthesis protein FliR